MVAIVPESVIDAVTEVIVYSPMHVYSVMWRKCVNAVSVIMRTVVVEYCRVTVLNESSIAWSHSWFHRTSRHLLQIILTCTACTCSPCSARACLLR